MKRWREHPAIKTFGVYWEAYGRLPALLSSPYVYLAVAFTAACYPLWSNQESGWQQIVLDVVPSMLGFSMGGMAIVLAFATSKAFSVLAEDGARDSFFIKLIAAFFHFILVQGGAILIAVAANSYENLYLSAVGFFLFSYAVLAGVATAGQLLNSGYVLNFAASVQRKDDE